MSSFFTGTKESLVQSIHVVKRPKQNVLAGAARWWLAVALCAFCVGTVSPAFAQRKKPDTPNKLLLKARAKYDAFEYPAALELLEILLETQLSQTDEAEALALKGRILAGYECDAKAIKTYHALLTVQPDFVPPPEESPKIVECFEVAKSSVPKGEDPVVIPEKLPPPVETPPQPAATTATTEDEPSGVSPWVWAGVGIGVVAGVLVTVLVVRGASPTDPTAGSLGSVQNWPP